MRFRIISDLHLNDGSKAEDFTGPDQALIDLLLKWWRRGDTIVLPGDGADLLQAASVAILRAHVELIATLQMVLFQWLPGNHDPMPLLGLLMMPPVGSLAGRDVVVHGVRITHASHLDPVLQRCPRLARTVCRAVGWLERRVHPDVDVWASAAFKWITRTGRYGNNMRYARALVAETKRLYPDVHTIVFGHTHKKWGARIDGIDVINAGCRVNGKQDSVTIELTDEGR